MRVEPYSIDSFVHVIKRGARGIEITNNNTDKDRFLRLLYYMNDSFLPHDWEEEIRSLQPFERPQHWPKRKALVKVLAYTLMPNHFHLLLLNTTERGISDYMQKVGQSMTRHFNAKYGQNGSLFQGSYRGKTIDSDEYLRYVAAYIMVKNVFELYPRGGLHGATEHFEDAWKWALTYPHSSFREYATGNFSPITDPDVFGDVFRDKKYFKKYMREVIEGGKWILTDLE